MLKIIDKIRLEVSTKLDLAERARLGQFMTPSSIADFMASLFIQKDLHIWRLLDPGAGVGSLSTAFLEQSIKKGHFTDQLQITAYEIDDFLRERLEEIFSCYKTLHGVGFEIKNEDFIVEAVNLIHSKHKNLYTHAILNPPYKKISSTSNHRVLLRQVGIETVNLYTAFVALALELLEKGGQLVAIIPRSFCNGPYYEPFRNLILQRAAIHHIHLFHSRDKAFKEDSVLQENIIILLERGGNQGDVTISTSTDSSFSDYESNSFNFNQIIQPEDKELFFHIPTSDEPNLAQSLTYNCSLSDLFVEVSTGPVVDFRLRKHIHSMPKPGTVPLFYPGHFIDNVIEWPKMNWKRSNSIDSNSTTEKWLYPSGFYTVVRRFSSKEEKRRINASVVNPTFFQNCEAFGFENRLNVFHVRKKGLSEEVAYGLAAFLNSTVVDHYFRRFNGHTQVNATDLRKLKYPNMPTLITLGKWAQKYQRHTQEMIDSKLETLSE